MVQRVGIVGMGLGLSLVWGCGGAGLVLKSPIADQCAQAGLKGCPALAEGVVQYIDGDKSAATEKLKLAASANSPEKLMQFASAARMLSELPGAGGYAKPIRDALDILVVGAEAKSSEQDAAAEVAREAVSASVAQGGAVAALDPSLDVRRARTETVMPATAKAATFCDGWKLDPGGPPGNAACAKVRAFIGPLVVTDLRSSGSCPDELFVVAGDPDSPSWVLSTTSSFSVHGARFIVEEDQPMFIAARSTAAGAALKKSTACSVTWSGWKPDRVTANR